MKDLRYLSYVLRHKWHVLLASWQYGCLWRGIVHDLSKFMPSEWFPYVEWWNGEHGVKFNGGFKWEFDLHCRRSREYTAAWSAHIHRNPHHWQHWIIHRDDGTQHCLDMPDIYVREMMADWRGAAIAQNNPDLLGWYQDRRDHILLSERTQCRVELLLSIL